jgi:transcriptional regulator with XRE-family HTH domain
LEKLAEQIGKRLRNLREKFGLSQTELSRRLKIPNQSISNYERGSRQPDYESLILLADFYGVSIDYIIRGSATYAPKLGQEGRKVLQDIFISLEELKNDYTILLENEEVTDEELDEVIIYLKTRRMIKYKNE